MESSDLELLGRICAVVGGLCFLFVFFAYFFEERQYLGLWVVYPYRAYAVPSLFVAIILFAVSLLLDAESRKRSKP